MPGIDWELRLVNEVSASAKAMGTDMRSFVADMKQAQQVLDALVMAEKLEGKAAQGAKKEHEGFFGDLLNAELAASLIEKVADSIKELSEEFAESAAEAVDMDYKTDVALTHMTGSAEQAKDIMESARSFANGVGEDLDKVYLTYQKLSATGLRGDNLTAAADAAKDLAVVSGQSFDTTSALFEMIGSDKGLGGHAVRQLAQFPALLNDLEKHFGFVPGTAKSFEQLSKHLTEAPLKGAEGLKLLEGMVLDVAHEGQLGDVGVEIGDSFSGAANRFKNDWKEALGSISDDPAIGKIRSDISSLTDYFDPANAGGKELADTMKGLAGPTEELFGFLKENRGVIADTLSTGIEAVKIVLESVGFAIKGIINDIKAFQMAFQFVAALSTTGSFKKAGEVVSDYQDERTRKQHGEEAAEEQRRMSPAERKEQADLAKTPSPHELPALEPLPAAAEGGDVMSTGLVTVHEGEEIRPAGIARGGSTSNTSSVSNGGHEFHFHINMGEAGAGQMDEQLIAAKLSELAPGAIISALEQMNQMRGGQ